MVLIASFRGHCLSFTFPRTSTGFLSYLLIFLISFGKIIIRHKRIDYDLNVMRQSECIVINPITVDSFAALFDCTPVDRASDSMMAPTLSYSF